MFWNVLVSNVDHKGIWSLQPFPSQRLLLFLFPVACRESTEEMPVLLLRFLLLSALQHKENCFLQNPVQRNMNWRCIIHTSAWANKLPSSFIEPCACWFPVSTTRNGTYPYPKLLAGEIINASWSFIYIRCFTRIAKLTTQSNINGTKRKNYGKNSCYTWE